MATNSSAVLSYHLHGYQRVWISSSVAALARPLLFFVGFGLLLGRLVDERHAVGVPYLDFVAPGLIALGGLELAVEESTFPVLTHFKWQKIYAAMAATPLAVSDMVLGRLAYVLVRVVIASSVFLAVMTACGAVHSAWALTGPLVSAAVAAAVAASLFGVSAGLQGPLPMALITRLASAPLVLFSGVFFQVHQLPYGFQPIAWVLPLWHGVELTRAATLGSSIPVSMAVVHVAVLLAWTASGLVYAMRAFRTQLAD